MTQLRTPEAQSEARGKSGGVRGPTADGRLWGIKLRCALGRRRRCTTLSQRTLRTTTHRRCATLPAAQSRMISSPTRYTPGSCLSRAPPTAPRQVSRSVWPSGHPEGARRPMSCRGPLQQQPPGVAWNNPGRQGGRVGAGFPIADPQLRANPRAVTRAARQEQSERGPAPCATLCCKMLSQGVRRSIGRTNPPAMFRSDAPISRNLPERRRPRHQFQALPNGENDGAHSISPPGRPPP